MTRKLESVCARKGSAVPVVTAMLQGGGATLSSRVVAAMRKAPPPLTVMPRVSVPVSLGSLVGRAVSVVQATSASQTVSHATVNNLAALGYHATTMGNANAKTTTVVLTVTCAVKAFTTSLFVKVNFQQINNFFT